MTERVDYRQPPACPLQPQCFGQLCSFAPPVPAACMYVKANKEKTPIAKTRLNRFDMKNPSLVVVEKLSSSSIGEENGIAPFILLMN